MVISEKGSSISEKNQNNEGKEEQKNQVESENKKTVEEKSLEKSSLINTITDKIRLFINKLISVLKRWFTVPEEEKNKKSSNNIQPSVENKKDDLDDSKKVTEKVADKPLTDYEKELKRIEFERKQKQENLESDTNQIQKQKVINKIRKAQEKQKRKLKK